MADLQARAHRCSLERRLNCRFKSMQSRSGIREEGPRTDPYSMQKSPRLFPFLLIGASTVQARFIEYLSSPSKADFAPYGSKKTTLRGLALHFEIRMTPCCNSWRDCADAFCNPKQAPPPPPPYTSTSRARGPRNAPRVTVSRHLTRNNP